ncbi:NADH-quinone oxidoreductase subunit J family protein [Rhodohalobacter sulfatireducens]|jgi:NADH-quinone oxidoreductase subunit J|uniref:NADH-quinone oxidoreductase subunit J n=1 Tax=Rhodohalobacter sulfatireducens TaxID=2911366 RepID=A0ABS9K933_9BACT|nr:NADH-quinone oxidoreductase subunit J [Rhodohalobacter sulfatireducens]MCG2587359.1 NADH-quinone oxidoreductase subunit J [Rhodohalobacter sulfatireducens]MDR9365701.1 NADH-quinone oxidoreductase subunit J [Balneolaceae bacterium]MDR9407826.1 NADH-quinone oxidoreductase subunit J [Balneolaceae bacterium]
MEFTAILFYVFAILTIGSASIMVFSKNIVHSAFALMFTLIGVAAIYVLLYADFLAATQLLVYVGGILILILFGVMLTSQESAKLNFKTVTVNVVPASILSVTALVLLTYVFTTTQWASRNLETPQETVEILGTMLMSDYLLPFIIAGVLLLIAIIGSILMATRLNSKPTESN